MTKWQKAAWAFLDRVRAGPRVREACRPYIERKDAPGFYRLLVAYHG